MSSIASSRAVGRVRSKKTYAAFSAGWRRERAHQRYLLANGEDVPEKELLGPRPSFRAWLVARAAEEKRREELPVRPPVDPEWEDE